jgi:hypothetical protein
MISLATKPKSKTTRARLRKAEPREFFFLALTGKEEFLASVRAVSLGSSPGK